MMSRVVATSSLLAVMSIVASARADGRDDQLGGTPAPQPPYAQPPYAQPPYAQPPYAQPQWVPPPAPPPPPPKESYGVQTLAVDALGVATGIAIALSPIRTQVQDAPTRAATIAATTWFVGVTGAPAIHFAHGRTGMGLADLGVRTFLPPLVAATGAFFSCADERFRSNCADSGLITGTALGLGVVSAVDALVLADGRPESRVGEEWYGWQTLIVDALGLGLGVQLAARGRPSDPDPPAAPLFVATGMYTVGFIGGPIVHFVNRRVGIGFADLGVRLVAPLVFVGTGVMGACASTAVSRCDKTGSEIGFLAGTLAVAAFDALVFGWKDAPAAPAGGQTTVAPRPMPFVMPVAGGAVVGAAAAL